MLHKSCVALSALLALGLAGSLAAPASAAQGQICYFGECTTSTAPQPQPQQTSQARTITQHGTWSAKTDGKIIVVTTKFDSGAEVGFVLKSGGQADLAISQPKMKLAAGQAIAMKINIDGKPFIASAMVYEDSFLISKDLTKAFMSAFFNGQKVRIDLQGWWFEMSNLADLRATLEDLTA